MHPLLRNVLILDIETASGYKEFSELSPEMQQHWERKSSFLRNEEERSAAEMYDDRAAIYAEFGRIITIGFGAFFKEDGKLKFRVKTLASDDEKKLIEEFVEIIRITAKAAI